MDLTALVLLLYQIGAVKFGEFTLKSGQTSKIYIDLRQIVSYPNLLKMVGELQWQLLQKCQFDLICGVPYTALPMATTISLLHNVPMVLRRKEKKEYGTKQQIEGAFKAGQHCLIVEDIITTGSSILETATDLEKAGLIVTDAIVLIDREQGGKENLQQRQYVLHSVLTLQKVLHILVTSTKLSDVEMKIVKELMQE